MRKFSSIIESTSEPSGEALWLNKGTLMFYNGQGWEPICHIGEHADIIKEMGDKIGSNAILSQLRTSGILTA